MKDASVVEPVKRRGFLSWLLGSMATAVGAAIVFPIVRFLVPPDVPEAASLTANAGPESSLRANSGKIVPLGSVPALLIRTPTGELRAFEAECTHLSCTVQYRDDLQQIWCACHNGLYDLTGGNISGPPPRPLRPYDVAVTDGDIIITRTS